MFASGYQADLDVNMDGAVDSKDSGVVSKLRGRSLGAGELSDRGNIVGWCGYLYEEATGMWLARHRWQIPELGRWANRDPIGYAGGGQNLYEYVNGNPVVFADPMGLKRNQTDEESQAIAKKAQSGVCGSLDRALARGPRCDESPSEWEERRAGMIHTRGVNNCGGDPPGTDYGAAYWKGFAEGAARGTAVTVGAVAAGALIAATPLTGGSSGVLGVAIASAIIGGASGAGGAIAGETFDKFYYGEDFDHTEVIVGGGFGAVTGGVFGAGGHGLRSALNSTTGISWQIRASAAWALRRGAKPRAHVVIHDPDPALISATNVSVYYGFDAKGDPVYVGITSRFVRRALEHLGDGRSFTIRKIPGLENLTRAEARGVEQYLIDVHGLEKNGGVLLNKINSIAKSNPIYDDAVRRGKELVDCACR